MLILGYTIWFIKQLHTTRIRLTTNTHQYHNYTVIFFVDLLEADAVVFTDFLEEDAVDFIDFFPPFVPPTAFAFFPVLISKNTTTATIKTTTKTITTKTGIDTQNPVAFCHSPSISPNIQVRF